MLERRLIVVRGRVQGVGYRWFVLRRARSLGVAGWVRNCPDGSVELEAQADTATLAVLESMLREGPRLSHVNEVMCDKIPASTDDHGFRIVF